MRTFLGLLTLMLFPFFLTASNTPASAEVKFYSESFPISYDKEMIVSGKKLICVHDKCLKKYYAAMKETPYQMVLDQLLVKKEEMQLNDWLYARMVRATVDRIYSHQKEINKALAWWFLLNESGYDIRLAHSDLKHVFLYAPSEDRLQNVTSFGSDGKRFYNLTAALYDVNTFGQVLNKTKYDPNPEGKSFDFKLNQLPVLKPIKAEKIYSFTYKGEEIKLNLTIDKNMLNVFTGYPQLNEMGYIEAPLSPTLANSLVSELEKLTEGKSKKETLEVLAAFTRTAFSYKWDWDVYDEDRPMFAEEVFHTKYSDHEDRCALYYYLVKEMLDLPVIVINHFNNNMTLGVSIDEKMKREFTFNGTTYVICDPTHPTSTHEIGRYPNGLTKKTATVVAER